VLSTFARKAAGASGARHSLRPHQAIGKRYTHNSGASRRGIAFGFSSLWLAALPQKMGSMWYKFGKIVAGADG
jgi:hypothetical protein